MWAGQREDVRFLILDRSLRRAALDAFISLPPALCPFVSPVTQLRLCRFEI